MSNLNCSVRDMKLKAKQLRRDGIIPGVIYGKNLDASVSIQMKESEIVALLKSNSVGSQVTLNAGKEEYATMIKNVDRVVMSSKIEHVEFQVLTTGEKIKTSLNLHFINKEGIKDEGNVQEHMSTIDYEVLPKDMIESLDVDLSVLTLANDIKVSDLSIANDERYHILTNVTATIANLVPFHEVVLESTEEEVAEVEVIGAKDEE